MKKLIVYMTMLIVICFATIIYADRMEVKPVTPVIKDGIEYSSPQVLMGLMGVVVAKNINTNREIWRRQIYEVKFDYQVDPDTQYIFITHLAIEGEFLLIVNERWQRFKMNLKTYEIIPYGEVERLYPAVANDQNIYASSTAGKLYAFNSDGHTKWVFNFSGKPSSPPSLANDDTIYASTPEALYAVNPEGVLKWEFHLSQNSKGSFSVVGNDGTIYLGTKSGIIYALSPDGKVKWEFNTRGIMWHPPVVSKNGTVYVLSCQEGDKGQVFAINKEGSKKWMLNIRDWVGRTPVIGVDDTIYVSESYSMLYAVSPKGDIKWQIDFGGGPFIFAGSGEEVFAADGTLYKINPDGTKEPLYNKIGGSSLSASVGVDKTIYMANIEASGILYSISPSGGLKWKTNLNSTDHYLALPLAVDDNGTVYIGYHGKFYGTLSAIDSDGKKKWEFTTKE